LAVQILQVSSDLEMVEAFAFASRDETSTCGAFWIAGDILPDDIGV